MHWCVEETSLSQCAHPRWSYEEALKKVNAASAAFAIAQKAMNHIIFVFVLLSLLAGCSPTRGNEYAVHLDVAFTAAETQAFLDGMSDWESNTRARFHPEIGSCPGEHDGQICAMVSGPLGNAPDGGGVMWASTRDANLHDGGTIRVDVDLFRSGRLTGDQFRQMAAHELGHALGLPHLAPFTLMAAANAYSSPVVTLDDVYEYNNLRAR